jgi:hypothetical protein
MNLSFERKPPPEPGATSRCQAGPWRVRRRAPPRLGPLPRRTCSTSLGRSLRLQLVRRHENDRASITRGLLASARPAPPAGTEPERGVNLPRIDTRFLARPDRWQATATGRDGSSLPALPAVQFDLRAAEAMCCRKRAFMRCA